MTRTDHPLRVLAKRRRISLSALSRMIDRNAAYLQQYIERGSPRRLSDRDTELLTAFFGVDDHELTGDVSRSLSQIVRIPRLDVDASAGGGTHTGEEIELGGYSFDRNWLRALGASNAADLSIIRVMGDSMEPTLTDGDDIMVDQADNASRLRDGIYVLRRDQTLLVKRLSLHPVSGAVTIGSDNPAHSTWPNCDIASLDIVGRVIWSGRRLR